MPSCRCGFPQACNSAVDLVDHIEPDRTLLAEALALGTHLDHPVYHCLDPRNRGALAKPPPALGDSPRAGNHDCGIAVVMIRSIAISLKIP